MLPVHWPLDRLEIDRQASIAIRLAQHPMQKHMFKLFSVAVACLTFLSGSAVAQSKVELVKKNGQFQLLRNGKPFVVKGVGGDTFLPELASAGGNAIRTWDTKNLAGLLDKAHENGLTVCAGLWLGHQRHGFNYQNQEAVLSQLDGHLAVVRKFKNHPALLMWGVGNEMEGEGTDPSVWYAVNHLAREIKKIDPNHPTMTVIAELGENESKIHSIERFCPDVDIVGLNSYGGIESIGDRFRTAKSSKPYIITEHGTLGPWECGKTAWGSPIEFTSTEKANWYANGYRANASKHSDICLGTFAFLWGHKQETTATWFGMLLPDGTRLGAVDAMSELWTGLAPKNRCPQIASLTIEGPGYVAPGAKLKAALSCSDPERDKLRIKWLLRSDSGTIGEGGDPQESESDYANAIKSNGRSAEVTMPDGGGGYRLFAYVYDRRGGAAVANVPLKINAPIKLESVMPASKLPYIIYGDGHEEPSAFVPAGFMGNVEALVMDEQCMVEPHSGKTCLKFEYNSNSGWGGVLWQSPAGDWNGDKKGGANLSGATHLEFWVRGKDGGEKVNFVFGVLDGNQPYRDTAKAELKDFKLEKDWKQLSIPLEGLDLRQIKTGFGWSAAGQARPIAFFLDDIQYVAK